MGDYNSKYTGAEVEEILDSVQDKQDKIADLEAIREGASKGATALQSVPSEYVTDSELSAKGYATTTALNGKVDKVSGKQLSTEDFTTALKSKLESLSNYDDTSINQAVALLRSDFDKLVSGDTTTAIKTFNEVIAFLDGISDTQDLSSIIASIEQQIGSKQDKINDLATIRSGAEKGATAVQPSSLAKVATSGSYNDLSDKPTIPSTVTESVVSGWGFTKNTGTYSKPSGGIPKTDLASAVQTSLGKADTALQSYTEQYKGTITGIKMNGASKGTSGVVDLGNVITAHQDISGKQDKLVSGNNIKTINGQSILGSGNITIEGGNSSSGIGDGESSVFITHFTINEFASGYVEFSNEQKESLKDAARQNKIIALPHYNTIGYTGFTVASYLFYESEHGDWSLHIEVIVGAASYNNILTYDTDFFSPGKLSITTFSPLVEWVQVDEDGFALADSYNKDNVIFNLEGECRYLQIGEIGTSYGMTIRFFTGEDCTIEYWGNWANGIIPTIEPYTAYEMSIAYGMNGEPCAVLTPFKYAE